MSHWHVISGATGTTVGIYSGAAGAWTAARAAEAGMPWRYIVLQCSEAGCAPFVQDTGPDSCPAGHTVDSCAHS